MRHPKTKTIALTLAALTIAAVTYAQRGRWRDSGPSDERGGTPVWENEPEFKKDVFTFVRIHYDSYGGRGGGRGYRGGGGGGWFGGGGGGGWGGGDRRWLIDYPDSDYNFSFRLQQLTSLKVNPTPVQLRLTDPELFDYPFIYIVEPGQLVFSDPEVTALRRYLLNGGFLMVDDFWGDPQWDNFYEQIKRVFPEREPQELPLEHEIFHCVFRLKAKPQVPSIGAALQGKPYGITWEPYHGGDCQTVHYRGLFDDKNRLMAIFCHNTDLGDGWEREGEDEWYFHEFAENKAYPMGINIVTYAMTH